MKKIAISLIIAAVAALSVFALGAKESKAQKPADLDSIYQTIMESSRDLSMMKYHMAMFEVDLAETHEGALIEVFELAGEGNVVLSKGKGEHEVLILKENVELKSIEHGTLELLETEVVLIPKLEGTQQEKLDQIAAAASELKEQINSFQNVEIHIEHDK